MANRYPPTPSFGGGFFGYPFPSPQTQNSNGYPASAARPVVTASTAMPSLSTSSPITSLPLNISSFEANAQIPTPSNGVPFPPPPFPPELLKQFANSTLPPPPPPSFPPVPIPNLGFSSFPAPPSLASNSVPPQRKSIATAATDQSANHSLGPKYSQSIVEPQDPSPAEDEAAREEGELSDGEFEDSPGQPAGHSFQINPSGDRDRAMLQMSSRIDESSSYHAKERSEFPQASPARSIPTAPRYNANESGARRSAPFLVQQEHKMGNMLQRQRQENSEQFSSGDDESAYNPPSASTPDFTEELVGHSHSLAPPVEQHNALLGSSGAQKMTSSSDFDVTPSELREQAKGALLSLAPHNIRYHELVNEGIDPELLRHLYAELGIRDVPEAILPNKAMLPETLNQPKDKAGADNSMPNVKSPSKLPTELVAAKTSREDVRPGMNGSVPAPAVQGLPRNLPAKPPANSSETKVPQVPIETPQPETEFTPTTGAAPAPNASMERKDRIAQLLAAKASRPLPPRSTPDKSSPLPEAKSYAGPASAAPLAHASTLPLPPQAQSTPKSKNNAQTELVRQKMESLKREALAKAQAQNQSQPSVTSSQNESLTSSINTLSSDNESDEAPKVGLEIDDLIIQALPTHLDNRKDGDHPTYASRIPGLFMTTAEPADFEKDNTLDYPSGARGNSVVRPLDVVTPDQMFERQYQPEIAQPSLARSQNSDVGPKSPKNRLPQKRPRAADSFDEPTPPPKRPFGRKDSYDQVEIIVSDEESDDGSEGIGMDLDDDSEASSPNNIGVAAEETPRKESLRNLPPLTNFPSPRPTLPSTTSVSTAAPTPGKEKAAEDLFRAKNQEIEAMRRKIAEMEERRKAKKGLSQAPSPRSSAPGTPIAKAPTLPQDDASQTAGSAVSLNEGQLGIFTSKPCTPLQKLSESGKNSSLLSTPPFTNKSPSKTEALREKILRRKVLQDGLPDLNAEVQRTQFRLAETQAKLAEIKQEAERREAEIREARRREAEIAEEAVKLEEQLRKGLDGRNRYSEELQTLSMDLEAVPEGEDPQPISGDQPKVLSTETPAAAFEALVAHKTTTPTTLPGSTSAGRPPSVIDAEDQPGHDGFHSPTDVDTEMGTEVEYQNLQRLQSVAGAKEPEPKSTALSTGEDYVLPTSGTTSRSQSRVDEVSNLPMRLQNEVQEHHTFFNHPAETDQPSASLDDAMEQSDADGSVSMSDSGSEDYEPAEPPQVQSAFVDIESDGYEPVEGPSLIKEGQVEAESDIEVRGDYEPGDRNESQSSSTAPFSPMQPPEDGGSPVVDDTETGPQLTEADMLTKPQDIPQVIDAAGTIEEVSQEVHRPKSHFTPYASPLASMKNFRFHPDFPELVSGGYRSLTYSNTIDAKRPLCPTELAGEVCQDSQCTEQHFHQLALPDEKVLVQMSSANDIRDKDERDRYVLGLKQVIADLRMKGVKDFARVASELAAYRRRFREEQDPSLALPS